MPPLPPRSGAPSEAEREVEDLRAGLSRVYDRIAAARATSPRSAAVVSLVVVTKAAPATAFDLLRRLGERDVGENRVADALEKREGAPPGLVWHGIGHLQTNKVKKAVRAFDVFHAVDSLPLAASLAEALAAAGVRRPVYAQVNAARDPKKGGVSPEGALDFLAALAQLPALDVVGWMTMAKEEDEGERARPTFALMREIRDDAVRRGIGRSAAQGLSMGMSGDFEVAVEEGATVVRVGRAIWQGAASVSPEAAASAPAAPKSSAGLPAVRRTVGPARMR